LLRIKKYENKKSPSKDRLSSSYYIGLDAKLTHSNLKTRENLKGLEGDGKKPSPGES
jgi:hypothetical protein